MKIYFSFQLSGHILGIQGRAEGKNLEEGTDVETMEECCLKSCSLQLAQLFSYTSQDHLSRGSTLYSELGPSPTIISQDNTPKTGREKIRSSSSQTCLGLQQMIKTSQQSHVILCPLSCNCSHIPTVSASLLILFREQTF